MSIVSVQDAREHLRITSSEEDADLARKIDLASAIVFDYLKSRAHATGTIDTSSVANPTVITLTADHTFTNGQTVIISGHSDSVPSLNGSHVISNVTDDSFTVPVNVTTAGTGGKATVEWDETTAPGPVIAATLLMLGHLWEHRGDGASGANSGGPPDEAIWVTMKLFLDRLRDPALA